MKAKSKLVILGTGFASVSLLKKIDYSTFDVVVISPRNHFLFTPLLPSTTVGTIEFRSIIEPIRTAAPKATYYQAFCTNVLTDKKIVECEGALDKRKFEVNYDFLVIAVGVTNNTFGISGVKEHCFFLKELSDARMIRQRIIECFEKASQPGVSEEEKKSLLHFVVVGGGPTGVEFAAEMHDFLVQDLHKVYRPLESNVRITLLEAMETILGAFDATLRNYTTKHFERKHIEVKTKSMVTKIEKDKIYLKDGSEIPYGLIVWSAGVGATDLVKTISFNKNKGSRLLTDDYLQVQGYENIYALGDCATPESQNMAGTAQVAEQQGKYIAKYFALKMRNKKIQPFTYHHKGTMAYIGDHHALADVAGVKGKGFSTWLFWRSAYLTKLISLKNKFLVLFDWFKGSLFGRDVSRF